MRLLFAVASLLVAVDARSQRADDNAVTAAEDAFGATLGDESIGLYSTSLVRGFSPVTAGNVRFEGLYFDRQAWLPNRLVEGSTIRVGLSAQGYPFPAPTGIVDYRLHKVGDEPVISIAAGFEPYESPLVEIDAKVPLVPQRFGIAAGISYGHEEYYDGADAHYWRAALIPRWRPTEHIEILPFWGITRGRDEEVAPTIVTAGPYAPPEIERREYFGQTWADNENDNVTYGALAKARIGADWALGVGVFRSDSDNGRGFADVYVDTQQNGLTRELVIADPPQRYASTSGEVRVSRSFIEAERLHVVHMSLRGREVDSDYGGSATPLDLGWRRLGGRTPVARPERFEFGERTHDEVRQWTAGVMYEGRWRNVGEATLGIQRAHYEKRIAQPGVPVVTSRDEPWLAGATLAAHLTPDIALYAGYTRGLEESGVAPDNAANRNEALPAIRTRQVDAGIRWAIAPSLTLIAGGFEVQKPYFTTNENNIFTTAGEVRHRGLELSLAGAIGSQWNIVAGALLMEPRVTGEAVELGRVGKRPVGQSDRMLRANVEYRPPVLTEWSFDVGVTNHGERVATSDNRLELPSYTLIDIGARYRMQIGPAPATLRLQVANVTDEFAWNIFASNSFGFMDARRYSAVMFVDF